MYIDSLMQMSLSELTGEQLHILMINASLVSYMTFYFVFFMLNKVLPCIVETYGLHTKLSALFKRIFRVKKV